MVGTADSILIREVHVLVCPLVRFHFNILYSSGTVVGATECVCPGIRAVGSSKTQLTYPLMPAMKNDNALWAPYIATFSSNPTVPPMSTFHTVCETC